MGTRTDFRGAIRIVPCVSEQLTERLNLFFEIRHMRRDTEVLDALYPSEEERRVHSLLDDGDFGTEGAFFLPDKTRDADPRVLAQNPIPEGLHNNGDLNTPPKPLPSLYCDLEIVSDTQQDCSYIGWNGAEKAYCIADWIRLLANLLTSKGYHLDGKMFANVEDGTEYYNITVKDKQVVVTELVPDYTYNQEFEFAER